MKPRFLRLIASLVALLLAVTLFGCDSGGTETNGGNNDQPQDTSPPAPTTGSTESADKLIAQIEADPPGDCPEAEAGYTNLGHPDLTGDAATLYSDILVCSNGTSSFLVNRSDGVWVFEVSVPTMEFKEYGPHSRFFRLSGVPRNAYYMVPGDSVIIPEVTTISWYPNEMMTSIWATQELGLGYVQGRGEEYLALTLERKTGHSKAITECMFAAAQAAAKKTELDETSDLVDHLQDGLKTTKSGICLSAMEQADTEADAAGYRLVQAEPTWDARVSKLSSQAETGVDLMKFLHFGAAACEIAPRCN